VERTKELTCVEALGEGAGLPKEVLAERAHQAGGERTPLPADLPLLGSHLSPPPATTTSFSWTILVRRGGRGESRIREASRWPEGRRRGGRRRRLQGRRRRSSGEARGCGGGDRQRKFEPCINRGGEVAIACGRRRAPCINKGGTRAHDLRVHSLVYVYAVGSTYSEQFSSIVSQFSLLFLTFFF
jgi:hypothetical protein